MREIGVQLKQTIISTGFVGACFGILAVVGLALVAPGSNARLAAQGIPPPHWLDTALFLACAFAVPTIGAIVLFGLLPAAIGKLLGWFAKKSGGAA